MIAIKDFKMPSCCYDCDFSIGVMSTEVDRECTIIEKYVNDDDMPDWCPLVEVPDEAGNCSEFPNNSDCVSRRAAIDALKEHRVLYCDNTPETFSKLSYVEKSRVDELDTAIATLVNLPSAQPEIIRCKECVYADENYHCDYMTTWNDGDCFCCYGKRRTDGRFDKQTGGD